MKYLFCIARYKDDRQKIFDRVFSPRNQEFCDKHGYKYVVIDNNQDLPPYRNHPSWYKMWVIRQLLNDGKLADGDTVTWMDADILYVKNDVPFESDKSLTISIDSGNSHCFGMGSLKMNDWSRNFIENITDDNRYNRLINKISKHDYFGTHSSFLAEFYEQAMYYYLCGIKRHSQISFFELDNYGWHTDVSNETVYTLDELYKNVQILGPEFNCTVWEGESDTTFNINKVDKDKVVLRHFAGGSDWNNYKNWI